jgi:hydroxymethylpyrimidine pyrophosphatase-like HAD family hydrolase
MTVDIGKKNEFYTEKPKTIFCDIDGSILKHAHRFSDLDKFDPVALPGVVEKFNEWDSLGHKIILVTARKESGREMTERQLKSLGLMWDQLIMGVSSGQRILLNDKLQPEDLDRANSINLITDQGFINIDWKKYGL